MKTQKTGRILIHLSLLITFVLWLLAKDSIAKVFAFPLISLNQMAALLGTVLFTWSMILATRLDFLELLFGSLDKIYRLHRRVSEVGAVLIFIHPLFLVLDSSRKGLEYFLPIHRRIPVNLGVYSFWIFAAAILLTLFIRKIHLPYHLWKNSHKFLNLAMILALLHVATISSDTSTFFPLGIWMNLLVGFGVASGIYMSFFYQFLGPKYRYKIIKIRSYRGVHDIYLKPLERGLSYKLAQYVYVSFYSKNISKEIHPFCVSSLPGEKLLRLSIKELGDYTKTIANLKVGDTAFVYGPYGNFGERFTKTNKDSVFVAGGIGVAPFLSMFKLASSKTNKLKTSLFYCTKYKDEASFDTELRQLAGNNKRLEYCNQCSRETGGGHLSISQIDKCVRDKKETLIYVCGPSKMMQEVKKKLEMAGFLSRNIIFEDFEMF